VHIGEASEGVNLVIPVGDALDFLGVQLKWTAPLRQEAAG
jgi:hypothetical protein